MLVFLLYICFFINYIGSWASILGVLISVGTFIYAFLINKRVKNFSKSVLFNVRASAIKTELEQQNSKISTFLRDFSNSKNDIKTELSLCKASINSIYRKLPRKNQAELKKAKKMVDSILKGRLVDRKDNQSCFFQFSYFCKKQFDIDDVWDVYNEVAQSIKMIDNLIKDKMIL